MTDLATRAAAVRPTALRRAAPALLGYAAVRALGLAVLAVWSAARGRSAYTLLTARWDSLWYARVAAGGYGYEVRLPSGDVHSDLAFFPLLPRLERLLASVGPLSYADAGFAVSALASPAAAWGIFAVVDHVYRRGGRPGGRPRQPGRPGEPTGPEDSGAGRGLGRAAADGRVGVWAVLLWAALPVGIVQSMAYSESLFTALAAWSLYCALTGRWVSAGAVAVLAGLTRPAGLAVVAAVWTAALVSSPGAGKLSARGAGKLCGRPAVAAPPCGANGAGAAEVPAGPLARRLLARRLLGVLLAPLGAVGYVLWVGRRTGGGLFGYLDVQAGWRNGFDGGYAFARFVAARLTAFPSALAGLALLLGVGLVIWLYVLGVRQGQPLPLLVYTGAVTALALCASSYFGSKPRLLLPAFPLLLPLAATLGRARVGRAALTVGGVAAASAVYGAFWLNGSGPP
ncbi:hypothetical protein [Streptomyces sp. NPDC046985]|uniref:hypothetical protein n=1 Tax=Streptomyces sp. NPDC046985 TaxID=3155377 RepID=UPI003407B6BB